MGFQTVQKIAPQTEEEKSLQKIVAMVKNSEISSIKNVVSGILKIINDPRSTAKELKELIEIDPPLSAQVLKVANSAYYSPPSRLGEILKAILWVGYDAIKELVMHQKVCSLFSSGVAIENYSRSALWKHSVAVAVMGKMIYRREFGETGENMYAAGLLHDIGLIVEDQLCNESFTKTLRKSVEEKTDFIVSEPLVFGFTHAELGKAVIKSWDMPEELAEAIGQHHNPSKGSRFSRISCTLYLSDAVCQERSVGYMDNPTCNLALFNRCMKEIGVERRALDLISNDVDAQIKKLEDQGLFG
jgi:putative nucleotidyltransferase with HDIG domain